MKVEHYNTNISSFNGFTNNLVDKPIKRSLKSKLKKNINKMVKRKKFIELGNKRLNTTIKQIRLISNLSNKYHYQYSSQDAENLIHSLKQSINLLKKEFKA